MKKSYRRCLQEMCKQLARMTDLTKINSFNEETNILKLENFILKQKEQFTVEKFYYIAGIVSMMMINEMMQDSSEISTDGINKFEKFLGIIEEEK